MKPVFIACLLLSCSSVEAAIGQFDVYEQALRNDPVFGRIEGTHRSISTSFFNAVASRR